MDPFTILAGLGALGSLLQGTPDAPNQAAPAGGRMPGQQGAQTFPLPMPLGSTNQLPAIGIDDEIFNQAAKVAAGITSSPPPTVPLTAGQQGPPQDANANTLPPQPGSAPPSMASIGEILAASPQAIASVANLLGFNQQQERNMPAPIPGGTAGQLVQGLNLPQAGNIGSILSQIPRFR